MLLSCYRYCLDDSAKAFVHGPSGRVAADATAVATAAAAVTDRVADAAAAAAAAVGVADATAVAAAATKGSSPYYLPIVK